MFANMYNRLIAFIVILNYGIEESYSLPTFIDLTHPFKNNYTRTWPINKPFKFTVGTRGKITLSGQKNVYLENNEFFMPEHAGTHVDAPAHFKEGGKRIHQLKLEDLVGPGVKIDISGRAKQDLDTTVSVQDLENWEKKHGKIPNHAVVLLYTGQSKFYNDENKYFGREEGFQYPDTEHIHFPGFSAESAQWLVDERQIVGIGSDCPSFDAGQANTFPAHQIFLGNNVWGLENVANLDKLPESGYTIYNMVFKLYDGSGAPTRLYATLGKQALSSSNKLHTKLSTVYLTSIILVLAVFVTDYLTLM